MNYESREFVDLHVIDAIDKTAFENGCSDAAMLRESLSDTSINIVDHVARDVQALRASIARIVSHRSSYENPRNSVPYIHISCHGTRDFLKIGEQEMSWSVLSEVLLPLQQKTDYNVPISLSSCWGFHGAKLAGEVFSKYEKKRPYYSLVGPRDEEAIIALAQSFAHFYRYLLSDFKNLKRSIALTNKYGPVMLDYTYGSLACR